MILIAGPRRSGRTTQLIAWAKQTPNAVIVAASSQSAKYVGDRMRAEGVEGVEVFVADLSERLRGSRRPVGVDDFDRLARPLALAPDAMVVESDAVVWTGERDGIIADGSRAAEAVKLARVWCEANGVDFDDMRGPSRKGDVVSRRRRLMLRLRREGFSLPEIGTVLNRHHTTVLHYTREGLG